MIRTAEFGRDSRLYPASFRNILPTLLVLFATTSSACDKDKKEERKDDKKADKKSDDKLVTTEKCAERWDEIVIHSKPGEEIIISMPEVVGLLTIDRNEVIEHREEYAAGASAEVKLRGIDPGTNFDVTIDAAAIGMNSCKLKLQVKTSLETKGPISFCIPAPCKRDGATILVEEATKE
jgi:hypothetical protein